MGTSDAPSKANSPSQSGQGQPNQGQTKPQQNPSGGQQSPGQHKPSGAQQSPGQHKPADNKGTPANNPSRSAQSGAENIGAIGQGEDAIDDNESDPKSNKSSGASDRKRSDNHRPQVR